MIPLSRAMNPDFKGDIYVTAPSASAVPSAAGPRWSPPAEQDTYDHCGVDQPPPYYPTTGRFTKNRYYEIDPVGFDVATWFQQNQR